jgi:hypothetical protein
MFRKRAVVDPGLQQIADLERDIVLAHEQKAWSGVSAEEIARYRPSVQALALAVCDRLRREYLERQAR